MRTDALKPASAVRPSDQRWPAQGQAKPITSRTTSGALPCLMESSSARTCVIADGSAGNHQRNRSVIPRQVDAGTVKCDVAPWGRRLDGLHRQVVPIQVDSRPGSRRSCQSAESWRRPPRRRQQRRCAAQSASMASSVDVGGGRHSDRFSPASSPGVAAVASRRWLHPSTDQSIPGWFSWPGSPPGRHRRWPTG